jgi:hypothetical protein
MPVWYNGPELRAKLGTGWSGNGRYDMEQSDFVASLNTGSLRKLGEKTGAGIVNRFGPQVRASLDKTGWDGDPDDVRAAVNDILTAITPTIMLEVLNFLGHPLQPTEE